MTGSVVGDASAKIGFSLRQVIGGHDRGRSKQTMLNPYVLWDGMETES